MKHKRQKTKDEKRQKKTKNKDIKQKIKNKKVKISSTRLRSFEKFFIHIFLSSSFLNNYKDILSIVSFEPYMESPTILLFYEFMSKNGYNTGLIFPIF